MNKQLESKELVKQKLQVKAQHINEIRSNNNKNFSTDMQKFYRQLGRETIEINDPPEMQEVEAFWKNISSNKNGF